MDIIVKKVSDIKDEHYSQLVKQARSHQEYIQGIIDEVSRDADNINNPVPFLNGMKNS